MFEVNGRNFDSEYAFPPIDDENIQNAVMVAPLDGVMYVWGWNCTVTPNFVEVWGWEPLFPVKTDGGLALMDLICRVRETLGL